MLYVDCNPWGVVDDLLVKEGQIPPEEISALQALPAVERLHELLSRYSDRLEISSGGNQNNVAQNLAFLRARYRAIPLNAYRPFSDPARVNLYPRAGSTEYVNLLTPGEEGEPVFKYVGPKDRVVMSSAPPYSPTSVYWRSFISRQFGVYWNPSSGQVAGGLPQELVDTLLRRTAILQLNEQEAAQFFQHYGHLPKPKWVVVTRGVKGATLFADGRRYTATPPRLDEDKVRGFWKSEYVQANSVGCGDAVFAGLIYFQESTRNPDPLAALQNAQRLGAVMYRSRRSNYAALLSV